MDQFFSHSFSFVLHNINTDGMTVKAFALKKFIFYRYAQILPALLTICHFDLMHFPVHANKKNLIRNEVKLIHIVNWANAQTFFFLTLTAAMSMIFFLLLLLLIHLVFTWRSIFFLFAPSLSLSHNGIARTHYNKMDIKALKWLRLSILYIIFFFSSPSRSFPCFLWKTAQCWKQKEFQIDFCMRVRFCCVFASLHARFTSDKIW